MTTLIHLLDRHSVTVEMPIEEVRAAAVQAQSCGSTTLMSFTSDAGLTVVNAAHIVLIVEMED